jgi:transcriptional regulator with XRE-family HTH domain
MIRRARGSSSGSLVRRWFGRPSVAEEGTTAIDVLYVVALRRKCYARCVVSATLLVQARRSVGLSQRELAARAGVSQQEVARYERGRVTPSLERLRALVAACGLELTFALARADDSYDEQIATALALTPAVRLQRALADAEQLRVARAQAPAAPAPIDLLGVLRGLERAAVRYVLIGELAEVLHGSPLLPMSSALSIVARAGQRESLSALITASGGQPTPPSAGWTIDAPACFALESYGAELLLEPAPAGTHGYEDLRRDATAIGLEEDLTVAVASLVDLVRVVEASQDRARVPALRRTLELSSIPSPVARADAA